MILQQSAKQLRHFAASGAALGSARSTAHLPNFRFSSAVSTVTSTVSLVTTGPNSLILPKSFLSGSIAGFLGCMVGGVGGSFLMVPLLSSRGLVTRLSRPQAHGTSLVVVAATSIAGTIAFADDVDYEAAVTISLAGLMTARAGTIAASRFSSIILRRALGVFLLSVAPILPTLAYLEKAKQKENNENIMLTRDGISNIGMTATMATIVSVSSATPQPSTMQRVFIPASIGASAGLLAGLLGIGSGAVVVPALSWLTDKNHREILGTSLGALVFPAVTGTVSHYARGTIAMRVAPALAVGALAGGLAGGTLAKLVEEDTLKNFFGSWTAILGIGAWLL
jgi:uncharacterized protein